MKVDWVPLGEVCRAVRSPVEIDPEKVYVKAGVRSFGRGTFSYDPALGGDIGKLRFFGLEPDRLVISNIKGWEGAVAVTSPAETGRVVSNRFLTYASDDVSLPYLAQWFLSSGGIHALQGASPGSADRNRTLSARGLEALRVPLPHRPEQERIVKYLGAMSSTVAAHRRAVPAALTFPHGELTKLTDVLEQVSRSERIDPDAVYDLSGVKWYGQGLFVREKKPGKEVAASSIRRVHRGDLIYNRLFAWKQSFAIAQEDGWVSNEFPTFRINEARVLPRVLLACLLTPQFTEAVNEASTGTTPTSRNRLKERDFMRLHVRLPPMDRQPGLERALRLIDRSEHIGTRRSMLADALLPAARNEIFSAMV